MYFELRFYRHLDSVLLCTQNIDCGLRYILYTAKIRLRINQHGLGLSCRVA